MRHRWLTALVIGAIALTAAGCGSSKPAYCSAKTDLMNAVNGVTGTPSGHVRFRTSLQQIESSTKLLVNSAKSDFPSETQAVQHAAAALESTLRLGLSDPKAALRKLPGDVSAAKSAIGSFQSAAKAKCG